LELDPHSLTHEIRAKLLLGLVVPRPIAVVSSVSPRGVFNVAPFSYYNVVSDEPMALGFSMTAPKPDGNDKDTLRNVRPQAEGGVGEFVVNVATRNYAPAMVRASVALDYEESEFEFARLTPVPSRTVRAPRVKEARACFECRTWKIVKIGQSHLVIGHVTHVALNDNLVDDRMRVDVGKLQPVARLGGTQYCLVENPFSMTADDAPDWIKRPL
jgi:flavin reductase (DIM6/NTAB) family NADH-FMN oxidoreductase RutF